MGFAERAALYSMIEERRSRPVIAYVTSSRPGAQAQMAPRTSHGRQEPGDVTIPFRPVARSASGSTSGRQADMARRERPPAGACPSAAAAVAAAVVGAAAAG